MPPLGRVTKGRGQGCPSRKSAQGSIQGLESVPGGCIFYHRLVVGPWVEEIRSLMFSPPALLRLHELGAAGPYPSRYTSAVPAQVFMHPVFSRTVLF